MISLKAGVLIPSLATVADVSHDCTVKLSHSETDLMFTHELSTKADVLPVSVVLMLSILCCAAVDVHSHLALLA